jgi:hypothetical protein
MAIDGDPEGQLIARRVGNGAAAPPARRRAPLLVSLSIQFRGLIIFALDPGRRVDARPQARETCVGLRLKVREHLFIVSLDLSENFIGSRKHSPNKLDDLASQGVELAAQPNFDDLPGQGVELGAQPLYISLTLFIPTIEIAHVPPSYPTSS